jgi:hypothetical protein
MLANEVQELLALVQQFRMEQASQSYAREQFARVA